MWQFERSRRTPWPFAPRPPGNAGPRSAVLGAAHTLPRPSLAGPAPPSQAPPLPGKKKEGACSRPRPPHLDWRCAPRRRVQRGYKGGAGGGASSAAAQAVRCGAERTLRSPGGAAAAAAERP